MSEVVAAPPAPPTIPNPTGGTELKGIEKLMGDFNTAVTPKKPEPPAMPPAKEPAPALPKDKQEPPPKDDGSNWEKAPPRLRKAYEELKKTSETKLAEYETKLKALDSKKVETPADTKLIEKYQAEIGTLKKELSQTAYQRSDEFKQKYSEPLTEAYKTAVSEVKQLTIREGEGENAKDRPATEQDFNYVMNLPVSQQGAVARRMFGDSADVILTHRNELFRLQRDMNTALKRSADEHETRSKEQEAASKKHQETFTTTKSAALNELRTKHTALFGDDAEDTDGNAALKGGFDFVENSIKRMEAGDMSLEEQAIHTALIHARAAAFQREVLRNHRLTAKNQSLEEELKKFRKSDPGAGGDGGEKPPTTDKVVGISGMAAKFDAA